ncbi:hypothetical protein [Tomitella fengzijianii]|uniref:Sap, sulfolipid-1-addressing protein n=1 Tax=Tomitella fengzijianii TaxID=2597660 RepID=A0A516X1J5_9ACTN|nr:hypothetical protein [Tomitella fengzijianii]QDQ96955.1 hypothetical protein FO059_05925 [Tomitella fengzijianii]
MKSLVSIIPLAAVDAVNVLALLAVSYVWISSASRWSYIRTAVAFMVGGICGLALTLAFSFTVILDIIHRALDALSGTVISIIGLLIALAVIAVAARGFIKPPLSLPVHRKVHPALAFVLGVITWGAQSLTSAPFYGAIAVMAKHDTATRLGLSVVFVIIALLPVAALMGALALCSQEAGHRLIVRVENILPTASRIVSAILVVAGVVGAVYAVMKLLE